MSEQKRGVCQGGVRMKRAAGASMSQRQKDMRRILEIDAARWSAPLRDVTTGGRGISECAPPKRTDGVAADAETEAAVDAASVVIGSGGC